LGLSDVIELLIERHRVDVERALTQLETRDALILLFKEQDHARAELVGRTTTDREHVERAPGVSPPQDSDRDQILDADEPYDNLEAELSDGAGYPWRARTG
jgi:hypothetical protein